MKRLRFLMILPMCCMLMLTPVSAMRAGAVTVDINDNYDAGLIGEEKDKESSSSAESTTSSEEASSAAASSAATTATPTAAQDANNAASGVSTVTPTTTPATPTANTDAQTTDLPKTGDDDRITITFIAMLASFSVFLTALVTGKRFGKNA